MEFQYTAYDSFSTTSDCYADYFNTYFFFSVASFGNILFLLSKLFQKPKRSPQNSRKLLAKCSSEKIQEGRVKETERTYANSVCVKIGFCQRILLLGVHLLLVQHFLYQEGDFSVNADLLFHSIGIL